MVPRSVVHLVLLVSDMNTKHALLGAGVYTGASVRRATTAVNSWLGVHPVCTPWDLYSLSLELKATSRGLRCNRRRGVCGEEGGKVLQL